VSRTQSKDFQYWWTDVEWSRDDRTGAYAQVKRLDAHTWLWGVVRPPAKGEAVPQHHKRGTSKSQKNARAACRRVVRKLAKAKGPL
jgi:hypothetical protein